MKFSRTTTKIATLIAILSIAGFFIYQGVAGPMKINMPETNPVRLNSGLVGYWTFDGQDTNWGTNTTNDRSGNGYNGTMTNMSTSTSPVPGKIGQALNFDGSNDYVEANPTNWGGNFTVSLWVKTSGTVPNNKAVFASANSTVGDTFQIITDVGGGCDGKYELYYFDDSGDPYDNICFDSFSTNWQFLTLTRNGNTFTTYVNGTSKNSANQSYFQSPNFYHYRIGRNLGGGQYFTGSIDEVRVYNRAISASEVAELYQEGQTKINASQANKLTSGLVGYWTMDGGDTNIGANTTNDRSGNGYTGTLSGTTKPSQAIGKIGQGLNFSGVMADTYVALPTSPGPFTNLNGPFTVSAWIYPRDTLVSLGEFIISARNKCMVSFNSSGVINVDDHQINGNFQTSGSAITANSWSHVVVTFSGSSGNSVTTSNAKIYVNSISQSVTAAGTWSPSASHTWAEIGTRGDGGDHDRAFQGAIDEVRVYNRAISASEVAELYQEGQTKINASQANKLTSGLVGHWTFDGQDTNCGTNTTNDRSGNGYNGTMTNMSTTTSPVPGVAGQALNFDGVNDYVLTGLTISPTTSFTLEAWIYPTKLGTESPTGARLVASQQNGTGMGRTLLYISNTDNKWANYLGDGEQSSGIIALKNQWQQVVFIYNSSTNIWQFYVNGTAGNSDLIAPEFANGQWVIGAAKILTYGFFFGSIDEVRVYNRAISASEVAELYNQGR